MLKAPLRRRAHVSRCGPRADGETREGASGRVALGRISARAVARRPPRCQDRSSVRVARTKVGPRKKSKTRRRLSKVIFATNTLDTLDRSAIDELADETDKVKSSNVSTILIVFNIRKWKPTIRKFRSRAIEIVGVNCANLVNKVVFFVFVFFFTIR